MKEAIGRSRSRLPLFTLAGGLTGLATAATLQFYLMTYYYPTIVGGKEYRSWEAFVPIFFEMTVLFAGFFTLFALIGLCGLPRLFHPLDSHPTFNRSTQSGFFLTIEALDAKFDPDATRAFLESLGREARGRGGGLTRRMYYDRRERVHERGACCTILGIGRCCCAVTLGLARHRAGSAGGRCRTSTCSPRSLAASGRRRGARVPRARPRTNGPWHFFLDMKYQPKYTSQGQSRFFADGRTNRLPPEDTIPFDGTDYMADAGRHSEPNPDFLKADRRYYFGIANADAKTKGADGVEVFDKPVWKDGKLAGEGYYVNHIPPTAVERGRRVGTALQARRATVQRCTARSATAPAVAAAAGRSPTESSAPMGCPSRRRTCVTPEVQAQADGQLFNTITNGVRHMPAYGHQVKVQDRWAIVAYLRVLQYAAGNPK